MGLSNRLKERREQLGLTQSEVASLLGITPGEVGNYENGVSTPKADILFKVFDALKCDANYLFQDEMNDRLQEDNATPLEMEQLVKRYRALDESGKKAVNAILDNEYERCHQFEHYVLTGGITMYDYLADTKEERDKIIYEYTESSIAHEIINLLDRRDQKYGTILASKSNVKKLLPNAAHAISGSSKEDQDFDEDIMNGDDF